ncbi:MAG: hypothetical protein ACRC3H_10240 [Lachnospiraceae bacterium]
MISSIRDSLRDIFSIQSRNRVNKVDVMRGLYFVQKSLFPQLKGYSGENWVKLFFDDEKNPNDMFDALMELWDVIKKPVEVLSNTEKNKYKILNLIYEVDGYYYRAQYEKLAHMMETDLKQRLDDLCASIEGNYNNKIIMIFDMKMKLLYKMILDKFQASIGGFEYIYIKYHLAKTIISAGIVIVISGAGLQSFMLKSGDWERKLIEIPEPYRNIFYRLGEYEVNYTELRGVR